MDLWGNVNRWSSGADLVATGAMLSFVLAIVLWASVIAGYRHGGLWGEITSLLVIPFYFLWLLILLGSISATPETVNIYADIRWDFGRVFAAILALAFTIYGVVAHLSRPSWPVGVQNRWTLSSPEVWQYVHAHARLPLVVAGGLHYLILAHPLVTGVGRVLLSSLVVSMVIWYLSAISKRRYEQGARS
jgi:hypothetical protein